MISTYNALSEEYYFFLSLYILSLLFDVMFVAMPDFRPITVHSIQIKRHPISTKAPKILKNQFTKLIKNQQQKHCLDYFGSQELEAVFN